MAQHGLYQPRIADEHIRQLYQWAKRLEIPMTRLVNALLARAFIRLEEGVENMSEPPSESYPHMPHQRRRVQGGKPEGTSGG